MNARSSKDDVSGWNGCHARRWYSYSWAVNRVTFIHSISFMFSHQLPEKEGEFMEFPKAEINEVESRSPMNPDDLIRDADVASNENEDRFRTVLVLGSDLDVNQERFNDAKRRGVFEPNPDAQLVSRKPDYVPTQLFVDGPWQ